MPRINLVIPCWGGDRRGGHQDIVYCRKAINQLRVLRHNLNQITLCVAEEQQSKPFHDYINSLENETQLPIKVFKRKNVGLSYGAFSEVFDTYDNAFDYYILMIIGFVLPHRNSIEKALQINGHQ